MNKIDKARKTYEVYREAMKKTKEMDNGIIIHKLTHSETKTYAGMVEYLPELDLIVIQDNKNPANSVYFRPDILPQLSEAIQDLIKEDENEN